MPLLFCLVQGFRREHKRTHGEGHSLFGHLQVELRGNKFTEHRHQYC